MRLVHHANSHRPSLPDRDRYEDTAFPSIVSIAVRTDPDRSISRGGTE
jgi:hypothetical protein